LGSAPEDSASMTWDVIIVGAGPAGAATAATLASLGERVLLVDAHTSPRATLGESLPPIAIGLVNHFLGEALAHEHNRGCAFRTSGNVSLWATEQADVKDFFFTATGFGLCVDRRAFDEALRTRAVAVGATLQKGLRFESCVALMGSDANWEVSLRSAKQLVNYRARYLVDCSGRGAVVAKALGVPIIGQTDNLFAYAQWFSLDAEDDDRYTRLEASQDGWWYSNRLPTTEKNQTTRLVVFHCDKDLPQAKAAANQSGFNQLLSSSAHIGPLLKAKGYQSRGAIRGSPANSQRLATFCGDGWLAVGDSAQAYDPLSSQGIDKALRAGSQAGHMIHYALRDSPHNPSGLGATNSFIERYEQQQQQLWQTYVSQLNFYYRQQTRWAEHPFWQRRHKHQHHLSLSARQLAT